MKEVMKNMTKKQRTEYIWDYYKIYIILTLVAIIIVSSTIYSKVTEVKEVFNLTIIGNMFDQGKQTEAENMITKIVVPQNEKKQKATIQVIPIGGSNDGDNAQMNYQYMQKFMAQIATHELDIVVMDKSYYSQLLSQEGLLKLDNSDAINGVDKTKLALNDSGNGVYGVYIEGNKYFENMGFITKDKVMCIVSNSERHKQANLVFKWILNYK